jgi:RsiW-degrading membrane proteinase PrsW (M82 family)
MSPGAGQADRPAGEPVISTPAGAWGTATPPTAAPSAPYNVPPNSAPTAPATAGATPPYSYPPPYRPPAAAYPYGYQPSTPYSYYYPYYYPNGYPYYGGYQYPPKPRQAKGEGYRTVIAWIVTIGSALLLLGGMGLLALLLLEAAGGARFSLAALATVAGFVIGTLAGGGGGLYFGITALLKRPSARFGLPPAWYWLLATVAVLGGEVVLWNLNSAPGAALAILPLFMLAGALPAGTILAYAARRLGSPSTWRHMLLSLVYGAVVATLVASIVETLLFAAIVLVMERFGANVTVDQNFLQNFDPTSPIQVLLFVLLASVVAPIVEEGFKPLGAVLLLPRVRGPAEAFLLGLAAGEGFAVIETLSYFGLGQADWITVAIDRVGAGLLHGVGAGLGALGWYYLIRGKGVNRRWLLGFGALGYAVLQHAVFNASGLIVILPPIGHWLNSTAPLVSLGALPIERSFLVELTLYALVFVMLTYVTGRLRHAPQSSATGATPTALPGVRGPEQVPALAMGGSR